LQQVSGFLRALRFPPPINLDLHDIAEILLNTALNTITQAITLGNYMCFSMEKGINIFQICNKQIIYIFKDLLVGET
jgi:hypothetical protein